MNLDSWKPATKKMELVGGRQWILKRFNLLIEKDRKIKELEYNIRVLQEPK